MRLEEGPLQQLVDRSLDELGLRLRDIRIKYPRDSFFSKGWRPACFFVGNLAGQTADDELYHGRKKLVLRFDLPRGSYATILVKRLTVAAGGTIDQPDAELDGNADEETEATDKAEP